MPSNPDEGARKETVGFSNRRPQSKSPVCDSPVRWEYLPHSVELQQNGLHCFHQMCFILYLSHNLGNGGTATWRSGTHSPTDGRHKARQACRICNLCFSQGTLPCLKRRFMMEPRLASNCQDGIKVHIIFLWNFNPNQFALCSLVVYLHGKYNVAFLQTHVVELKQDSVP